MGDTSDKNSVPTCTSCRRNWFIVWRRFVRAFKLKFPDASADELCRGWEQWLRDFDMDQERLAHQEKEKPESD